MLPEDGEAGRTRPAEDTQGSPTDYHTEAPETEGAAGRDDDTSTQNGLNDRWWVYFGTGQPQYDSDLSELLPPPPPWRRFTGGPVVPPPPSDDEEIERRLGRVSALPGSSDQLRREVDMVNAALLLRRPLLVTGRPGTGKSSLAYRISRELRLGRVLRWHITSRTTLRGGLYEYDAIGRVQDAAALRSLNRTDGTAGEADRPAAAENEPPGIGDYLQLGPLGTALLPYELPRVLLVDELDKSDQDLANDLLSVFEEGQFQIPELVRARRLHPGVTVMTDDHGRSAEIIDGIVKCRAFPVVVITSNGEREFPPAFLRRCLRLRMPDPDRSQLVNMVMAHLATTESVSSGSARVEELIDKYLRNSRERGGLAIDQLLNATFVATSGRFSGDEEELEELVDSLWHRLDGAGAESRSG